MNPTFDFDGDGFPDYRFLRAHGMGSIAAPGLVVNGLHFYPLDP